MSEKGIPEEPLPIEETWAQKYWRPAVGWSYVAICLFDFILAPVFFGILAAIAKIPYIPWKALTVSEAGVFHITMGIILGIYAYGRTQEKKFKLGLGLDKET